jgi:hypothetical protein
MAQKINKSRHEDLTLRRICMETDVNVLGLMLVLLGLGSSLIHYSKYAAEKARQTVKNDLNNDLSNNITNF